MTDVEIKQCRYADPAARELVGAMMVEMGERYGSGDETPVDPTQFDPPDGDFLIAWVDGEPVACGGWRRLVYRADGAAEEVAEVKRMYTAPTARKLGLATRILRAVEQSAHEAGLGRMVLETGDRQPEAIAFYQRNGYRRITDYGHYRNEPGVESYGLDLSTRY